MKHNAEDTVNRYKARLVAKGYVQTHGVNYEETFVEYKFIMAVFTLSLWTTQVWAIYVNSIKGS